MEFIGGRVGYFDQKLGTSLGKMKRFWSRVQTFSPKVNKSEHLLYSTVTIVKDNGLYLEIL